MNEVVLDAGPLIHLAELDALDILADFEILQVPEAVWDEVLFRQPNALAHSGLKLQRLTVPPPSVNLQALARALSLDAGEIEALTLLESRRDSLFLTDDAAARLAAEQQGYRTHGTIGLIIRSVRKGRRTPDEALALLKSLPQRSSLHIRPALLAEILEQLTLEWSSAH
jgi:predicted nucleic acid-binding protein